MIAQHTYEIHMTLKDGQPLLELITCSEQEIVGRARRMVEGQRARSGQVRRQGRLVFEIV